MKLIFDPEKHSYVDENNQEYLSVTKLLSKYKQPFDADSAAAKASKNRKSKWYKIPPDEIKRIWKQESDRSTSLGNWYHDQREKDLLACNTISYENYELPIYTSKYNTEG